ncbi:hypothetical protein BT63DRAFT_454590 [Microthyrium microscopicum]|uniref:RRM domain-containing protein n=1 Tax=Microthyrium microscopicum TaxID=703497 RepID=A0A6A6UH32_9PEZI|nr:hypothetical protein BT63DRAFT_454590 [Microthyrium microscopicum]
MDFTNTEYQADLLDFQSSHGLDGSDNARILVISGILNVDAGHGLSFTKRTVERLGNVRIADADIVVPGDANGQSKGYAFVIADSAEQAAELAEKVDGFRADRQRTFSAQFVQN